MCTVQTAMWIDGDEWETYNAFQILGLIIALSQLQYISVYVRKRHHQAKRGMPGETVHIFQILELTDEQET
jgi:hypothetical protein